MELALDYTFGVLVFVVIPLFAYLAHRANKPRYLTRADIEVGMMSNTRDSRFGYRVGKNVAAHYEHHHHG